MLCPVSNLRTCASVSAFVPCKNIRRLFLTRNQHARSGPRKAAHSLLHIDAQRQRWEPSEVSDALANILVQGDSIAKTGAARVRRSREKAIVRRMPAIHVWV